MDPNPEEACSSVSSSDCRSELADKICVLLRNMEARPVILGVLAEYDVQKQKTELVVYNGGETDYLIKRFLIAKKVQGCTDRTCKTYGQVLTLAFKRMGKSPTAITHVDVQALIARQIVKGDQKATQQLTCRTLSSFFGWMTREEIIVRNPMLKVDTIKMKPPRKHAFSDTEVELIRNACKTNREKAMVETLLSTGCRVFEMAAMTIEQTLNREEVQIIGKGEKPRTVFLNAKAQIAIKNYIGERKDKNPYLFPASILAGTNLAKASADFGASFKGKKDWYKDPKKVHPTEPLGADSIRGVIHKIGNAAGVDDCHPHRFRRTCATMALHRGMPLTLVQQMLGHDSLDTTQRYLDIQEDELREAHRRFVL